MKALVEGSADFLAKDAALVDPHNLIGKPGDMSLKMRPQAMLRELRQGSRAPDPDRVAVVEYAIALRCRGGGAVRKFT